jgi:hypothetical protein
MIKLKSLLKESLLTELEFGTQKAFDAYQKQHDMRGDTQVTVAGKKMSVTQAAKQSSDKAVKGSSVFGNSKGGQVFGKKDYSVEFGDAGSDYAFSLYKKERDKAHKSGADMTKFPDFGSGAWDSMHSDMIKTAAEKNPAYHKIKGVSDKIEKMGYEKDEQGWGEYSKALIGKSFTKNDGKGNIQTVYLQPTTDGNIEAKFDYTTQSDKKRGGLMGLLGKKEKEIKWNGAEPSIININGKNDDQIFNDINTYISKSTK